MRQKSIMRSFSGVLIGFSLLISGCTFNFHSERTLDSVPTIPSEIATSGSTPTDSIAPPTLESASEPTQTATLTATVTIPTATETTSNTVLATLTESASEFPTASETDSETPTETVTASEPTIEPDPTVPVHSSPILTPTATTASAQTSPTPTRQTYRVRFFVQGKEYYSVQVTPGASVLPPTPPKIAGRLFVSWDQGLQRINRDLDVQALYKIIQITVTVRTQTQTYVPIKYTEYKFLVDYGSDFAPPQELEVPPFGMVFSGWRGNREALSEDTVLTAEYSRDPNVESILLPSGKRIFGYVERDLARDFLVLLNYQRLDSGLKGLETMPDQENGAIIRALEISENFSYIRPNGDGPWTAYNLKQARSMSENIFFGSNDPEAAFEYWNKLIGHRENMFGPYDGTVVVVIRGEKHHYWVQGFFSD